MLALKVRREERQAQKRYLATSSADKAQKA
jgi:hypothetical protein